MCGIAGILNFDRRAMVDQSGLRRMCSAMVHRGPDDEGILANGPVGLAMRRLSIVDVAAGHQPLSNEDGTVWIVFNGEIYNHMELRAQLETRGHIYRTRSDTETIVHLYEEYGEDCVHQLRGMFAFAVWDENSQRLFLARDRFGIKPLYYRLTPENLVFSSEIKAILACDETRPEFRRACLPEYLAFGYLSGEETFYAGINKLLPGHTLSVDRSGQSRIERYWDLQPPSFEPQNRPERYYVETFRERLEEAVRITLMSDVPVGVFLSGGADSSSVAALMTRLRGEPVETFSVGYSEEPYSELGQARTVARHLKSEHREIVVTREDFFGALPKLIWHEDEPVVWPSSVPLYFVAKLASERVKVVLTGEGSDETLAGYTRYAFTLTNTAVDSVYRRFLPGSLRRRIREWILDSGRINSAMRRKLSHTFLGVDGEAHESFYFDNFFSAFHKEEQEALLAGGSAGPVVNGAAYANVLRYWNQFQNEGLWRLLYTDIKTYLVELLMKQDNMSMAASVESRVPFLDHVLAEFAVSIPQRAQVRGMSGKRVLKKAMEGLVPREILYQTKRGFPTPWRYWLSGPQLDAIERLLLDRRSIDRGLIKSDSIERIFKEHRTGYRDNYDRIWRLLNLELWHRVCLEGDLDGAKVNARPLSTP